MKTSFASMALTLALLAVAGVGVAYAQTNTAPGCIALSTDLSKGSTDGSDIITLQTYLQSQGYFSATPVASFGPLTYTAVVNFQKAHDLPATGYVGPLTRALIKKISCTVAVAPAASTTPSLASNGATQTAAVVESTPPTVIVPDGIALPYKTSDFTDWTNTWGIAAHADDGTLWVEATTTTTGGEGILPDSNSWTDYNFTVNANVSNGDIGLMVRRTDDANFYACIFNGPAITIEQRIDNKDSTVAATYISNLPNALAVVKNVNVSAIAKGNTISCSELAGEPQLSYTITDPRFMSGGIGITTWNQALNIAQVQVRSVDVEKI